MSNKFDAKFISGNYSEFEIYTKRCLFCKKFYEFREIDAYETYIEMCRTCDSVQHKKLSAKKKQNEVVVLFEGIWRIFNKNFYELCI